MRSLRLDHICWKSNAIEFLPCKRSSLPRYYLYSKNEIADLLRHAKKLRPDDSIRPHCFHTLVGLLYASGLRIAEALPLNLGHVDTDKGILFVHKGKVNIAATQIYLHVTPILMRQAACRFRNTFTTNCKGQ